MKRNIILLSLVVSGFAAAYSMTGSRQLTVKRSHAAAAFGKLFEQILIDKAHASGGETLLQTVRVFYRMALGMNATEYAALPPDAHDIVGEDGMLGKIDTLRMKIANSAMSHNSSIQDCADVPASGSYVDEELGTVTFAAPSVTAPAGYPNGGGATYEKRIEFSRTAGTVVSSGSFEFNCDVNAMMAAFKYEDSSAPAKNHKLAIFFDGEDNTNKHFQFYMDVFGDRFAIAAHIESGTFHAWVSSGKPDENGSGDGNGYRMAAIGHLDTGKVSFYADDTLQAGQGARIGATTVTGGNSPDGGVPYQGCANNFDHDPMTITTDVLCGSDVLTAGTPSLPGLSDLSTKSVFDHVAAGIDTLL